MGRLVTTPFDLKASQLDINLNECLKIDETTSIYPAPFQRTHFPPLIKFVAKFAGVIQILYQFLHKRIAGNGIPVRLADVTKISYRTHLSVKMTRILREIREKN